MARTTTGAQYLVVGNHANLRPANVTVALWYKGSSREANFRYHFSKPLLAGEHASYGFSTGFDTPTVQFGIGWGTSAGNETTISTTQALYDSAWHHVCGTYDAANMRLYTDGVQRATTAETRAIAYSTAALGDVSIGTWNKGEASLHKAGTYAEVAVWSVALTASEVAALAKGAPPNAIRPDKLVMHVPLWGQSPEAELTAGVGNATITGSPTIADHSPTGLYVPWSPDLSHAVTAAGGPLARTALDSAPATDTVTRSLALPRSLSDSAPAADGVTRAVTTARTASDIAPATETAARQVTAARSVSDSAPASDTATRGALSLIRTAADSAPATDTTARMLTQIRAAADTAPATDSTTRTVTQARTASDTAPASDAIARTLDAPRSATDAAPATDTVDRALTQSRSVADIAEATDATTRTVQTARTVADDAPATDSASGTVTPAGGQGRTAADSAPATDVATRAAQTFTRTAADTAPAADTAARLVTVSRTAADLAAAADAAARALLLTRLVGDTAAAADSAARGPLVLARTAGDNAPATDAATGAMTPVGGTVPARGTARQLTHTGSVKALSHTAEVTIR